MILDHRRTLERLIESLEHARRYPMMAFGTVDAEHATAWIHGIWIALHSAGLDVHAQDYREPALDRRGIYPQSDWHDTILRDRLGSETKVVDELLAIEIETIRYLHSTMEFKPEDD